MTSAWAPATADFQASTPSTEARPTDFRTVYETHLGYVLISLRRLGVPSRDQEDLGQEVFFVFHKQLSKYDPTRPLKPWLFGIAFRVASDYLRRARHGREVFEEAEVADSRSTPEEAAFASQQRAQVQRALMMLELDKRAVFVLHDIDGLPMREIAETLGVSANTLYSRLKVARERFTQAIRQLQGGDR